MQQKLSKSKEGSHSNTILPQETRKKAKAKREVHSNTILPQETRKTANRQPNFTPKTTGKRKIKQKKNSRNKSVIKI